MPLLFEIRLRFITYHEHYCKTLFAEIGNTCQENNIRFRQAMLSNFQWIVNAGTAYTVQEGKLVKLPHLIRNSSFQVSMTDGLEKSVVGF